MKLSVIVCANGNYVIHSEHGDAQAAIMEWHNYCRSLWNDKDTTKAVVKIMDENLNCYMNYSEEIVHTQAAE